MGAGEELLKKADIIIALLCRGPRGQVASDGELQSAKGDPDVRFEPRDWRGDPQKGKRFSQCDPAFLDMFAEMMDDDSDMPRKGKEEFAGLNRRSARLARGWAKRTRTNGGPAKATTPAASYESPAYGAPRSPAPVADDGFGYGGGYEGPDQY